MNQLPSAVWCVSPIEILRHLETAKEGLTSGEARQRLARYGSNLVNPPKPSDVVTLLLAQFKSPLILILLFATGLSFFLHDPINALIILTIVLVSGLLWFWQEHSATDAVEKLLAIVPIRVAVLRDGGPQEIPVEEIVPGRYRYSRRWRYRPGRLSGPGVQRSLGNGRKTTGNLFGVWGRRIGQSDLGQISHGVET